MEVYWTTAWANRTPTYMCAPKRKGRKYKKIIKGKKKKTIHRPIFLHWVSGWSLINISLTEILFFLKDLTIFKIQFMVSVSVVTVWRFSSWLKTVLREAFQGGSRLCHALEKKTSPSSTSKCSSSAYLPGLLCLTQEQQHITVTSRFPWHFWTICLSMARNLFSMTKEYLSPSP